MDFKRLFAHVSEDYADFATIIGIDSPGAFITVMLCFNAKPELGQIRPTYPAGIAMYTPVCTSV